MTKKFLVLCLSIVIVSGYFYAQDLQQLVGKTVKMTYRTSEVFSRIGVVTKVDEGYIYFKKSKEPWVKNLIKTLSDYRDYGKDSGLSIDTEIIKIFIIEEGKEDVLYYDRAAIELAALKGSKAKFFFLEKILVSPEKKSYPPLEDKLSFEDKLIHISWAPCPAKWEFTLKNKSEFDSLSVIWDQSSMVDQKGQAHKVLHKGTKLIDRNNPAAPSALPADTLLEDFIIPTDLVEYSSLSESWINFDIYEIKPNEGDESQPETIRAILTLTSGTTNYEYSFYFKAVVSTFGDIPEKLLKAHLDFYPIKYYLKKLK